VTTRRQQLTREQINIRSEVEYIVRRAAERDARVVTLGTLVFFSTETGDAWMLDPSDNVALCLARDGDLQPVSITETADTFAIDWNTSYQIKGEQFITTDRASRVRTIIGYPISDIAQAIRQVRESSSQAGSTVIDRRTQTESSEIPELLERGDQSDIAQQLEALIKAGYSLQQQGVSQIVAACDQWLEAWELVKQMAWPGMRTTDAFDEAYPPRIQPTLNWCMDLMFELHNAGISRPVYHEHRLRYINEFLAQFPDEDADTQVAFIRGQGEALWKLGRRAEAEAAYAALVERYPDKGWAYIGWSDHYWQWGAPDPKEYDRAEVILQQALAQPRLEDRADVLDRLCSLYGEWGQKEKLAKAAAQLEQATKQADISRYFPELPKPLSPTRPVASPPRKLGRNEPCWCGSGKKYKHCHMKAD
jgi:hypothetical protein